MVYQDRWLCSYLGMPARCSNRDGGLVKISMYGISVLSVVASAVRSEDLKSTNPSSN